MNCCLGIDCSSIEMGLGLFVDSAPTLALSRYSASSHAEHITEAIGYLLKSQAIAPESINAVGVAVGPGSFTGLRIAIAFLKGFAFGRDTRVLPLSSLESVALARGVSDGTLVVAFEARRGEVFWARFSSAMSGGMQRLSEDTVSSTADFISALTAQDTVVTDTLGYARSIAFRELQGRAHVYPIEQYPVSRGLACARGAALEPPDSPRWTTPMEVMPVYLRPSYAEQRHAGQEAHV